MPPNLVVGEPAAGREEGPAIVELIHSLPDLAGPRGAEAGVLVGWEEESVA